MKETDPVLQARHAAYQTPNALVFDIVREATGRAGLMCEKIAVGYDNEVYRVENDGGEHIMVRIRRHGNTPLAQEAWALAQARAAGAPVPDVLLLTTRVLDGDAPREVMVQRALPGRSARDLWPTWTPDEQGAVCAQAGAALRAIHSVGVGGFYKRHDDGFWDLATGQRLAEVFLRDRANETPELEQAGFSPTDIADLLRTVVAASDDFRSAPPVLCHGDFAPNHWIVDDDLILRGVIDFGDFQGGPAFSDLVFLHLWAPDLDLETVHAGYGDAPWWDTNFPFLLRRQLAGLCVGYLAHAIRQEDRAEAALLTRYLRATLDVLRKEE